MHKENAVLWVVVAVVLVAMVYGVLSFTTMGSAQAANPDYYGEDYQKALAAEDPADICATPSGYSEEGWKEHMSHHPDQYPGCL